MAEEVQAPLAGNIWEVNVKVGDTVEEDDDLLVIEAPCSGKVIEIKVQKGDQVDEDQVLVLIEPE